MTSRSGAGPASLLPAALVAAPVLVGVIYAAGAATGVWGVGASGTFDLSRSIEVLGSAVVVEGTLWTLWIGAATTVLSALIAAALALAFRASDRFGRWGRTLAVLPLPVPHLVGAVAALLILGQSGLLARLAYALGWIAGPGDMPALVQDRAGIGMIMALLWKEIPFLFLVASSVLATRGEALEGAARRLGASRWQTLRRVTWPLLWRGMLPACVAVFTFVVGTWEVAALLAPSDPLALPLITYERYVDSDLARRPDAFVVALVGMAIAVVAVGVHEVGTRWRGRP